MRYVECPVCDAEIELDEDVKPGEEIYCNYCKVELKLIQKSDGKLIADFEDEY
jgi:hypothetical protein